MRQKREPKNQAPPHPATHGVVPSFTSKNKTAVSVNWIFLSGKNENQKIKPHPTLQLMELSLDRQQWYRIRDTFKNYSHWLNFQSGKTILTLTVPSGLSATYLILYQAKLDMYLINLHTMSWFWRIIAYSHCCFSCFSVFDALWLTHTIAFFVFSTSGCTV